MATIDHGLEVIRKSSEKHLGSDSESIIRTRVDSGTITANAGTNLNTSALALDSTVSKDSSLSTINNSVNTLLKPSSTLNAVNTLGSISSALPAGANVIGQVTANAGTNLNTSNLAVETTQLTQNTIIGALIEPAPLSDIGSSGLNGRLQRIAQRISSLIGLFPTSVGQKTMANSLAVTIASDQVGTSIGLVNDGSLYCVSTVLFAATSDIDNGLVLIRNPAGSGKFIYVWRGRFGCITTNVAIVFKIFANPTVTLNGTSLGIVNRNIGMVSPPASVALVTTLPTIAASGSTVTIANVGQNNNSIDLNEDFSIKLSPGNSLLITASPNSNNRPTAITLVWQERLS